MATSKHATLSYYFENRQSKIITPVQLYSFPFNSMLSLSTNALWDTGASISAITPEIRGRLKATSVDRKIISGVHIAQEVDIVYIRLNCPIALSRKVLK